ncbi:MAG TPA: hypothetical protein VGE24_11175 [Emticicia sp.]
MNNENELIERWRILKEDPELFKIDVLLAVKNASWEERVRELELCNSPLGRAMR